MDHNNDNDYDDVGESVESTEKTEPVSQVYAVSISDTGTGAASNVNDGGDDDSTINGKQSVDNI